jgi:hypothetical protein
LILNLSTYQPINLSTKKKLPIKNKSKMKSLVKKKATKKDVKVAQCCAKTSKTIVGCHD